MRVKKLLASSWKIVPEDHFGEDCVLTPPNRLGNDAMRSMMQRKMRGAGVLDQTVLYYVLDISSQQVREVPAITATTCTVLSLLLVLALCVCALLDSVHRLDDGGCVTQVALLRDFPSDHDCLALHPSEEEAEAHWICVGLTASSNRIR